MSLFFVTRLRWIFLVIDSTNRNESNCGSYDVTIIMATGLVGRWLRFGPSDACNVELLTITLTAEVGAVGNIKWNAVQI